MPKKQQINLPIEHSEIIRFKSNLDATLSFIIKQTKLDFAYFSI